MRLTTISIGLLALLTPLTAAWSKEDREIFRVRDELSSHEGADVTFYSFLGITPNANQEDINRAYRKRSKALHPDKVKAQLQAERAKQKKSTGKGKKGVNVAKAPSQSEIKAAVKEAGERQARLSIVANILKGSGRERYDHFMANGFPVWKGTGYYYNRYRPGFGTVLVGVLMVGGGGFHYLALYMSWKRQREFVERYIKFARHAAWGENLAIPGIDSASAAVPTPPAADDEQPAMLATNRKQRRLQEREAKREAGKESKREGRRRGARTPASGSATPQPRVQSPAGGDGPTGAKKRVVAENGKVLVVDSLGDVYLEQEDADGNIGEFLLDPNELPRPTIKDTALYRLPRWAYRTALSKATGKKPADAFEDEDFEEELVDDDSEEPGKRTPSTDSAEDFELLDKSVDDLTGKPKTTGSQSQGGKASKRKNKKR